MIIQILSLMTALYGAIGPGFLLALAWPFFVIALIMVVRAGLRGPMPAE